MPALNIIELNIDSKTHNFARIYSSLISDEYQRKRAYASMVALYALSNLIEKTPNKVQKAMTLFRQPKLNEEYEINDFYVNNWHIDVRVIVDGDAVLLPKKHFDNNILPDYYAIVKVDKFLNSAELLGFIDPKNVNKQPFDYHYLTATIDNLISYNDFLDRTVSVKQTDFSIEEHQKFKEKYLNLLDDEIDVETKNSLIRHLFACPSCRTEFCCFTGFEMVSCNIGKYPELMEDKTLDIVGALAVDNEQYKEKEEKVSIVDGDKAEDDNQQDTQEFDDFSNTENQEELETSEIEPADEIIEEDVELDLTNQNIEIIEEKDSSDITPEELEVNDLEETTDNQKLMMEIPENNLEIDNSNNNAVIEEKEETVSDILDELFSIDEVYEDTTINEKSIDIQPTESNYEEEIIPNEELNKEYDEIDNDFIERDLKLINEDTDSLNLEGNVSDNGIEPIEIQDGIIEEEITPTQETTMENVESRKVIVDYNENGEPIYSYITDIPEDTSSTESDFALIDGYENLDEQFASYSSLAGEDYDAPNADANQYETIDLASEYNDTPTQSEIDDTSIYFDEPIEQNDEQYSQQEQTKTENIIDFDEDNSQEIIYKESSDDEEVENYEEYETFDESNEQIENTEDEEFLEYDEENFIPKESQKKGNNNLIAALVLLIIIAGSSFGIYKFLHNKSTNNIANSSIEEVNNIQEEQVATELNEEEIEQATSNENEDESIIEEPQVKETTDNMLPDNLPALPEVTPTANNINLPPLTEKDLLQSQKQNTEINNSLASAFSSGTNSISLKNINWLCTPQLFTDKSFKNFLQDIDVTLKINLRKNILNATETPSNTTMSIKMAIDNNGKIERIMISDSSGSEQIDNIVLQSINETLENRKTPILNDSALKADRYHLKVVIKL